MKLFLITLITFLFVGTSLAQDVTIRGQVHDKANGEPMITSFAMIIERIIFTKN